MGTGLPPAGWYEDPEDATHLRWWDGAQWTPYRHATGAATPAHGATTASPTGPLEGASIGPARAATMTRPGPGPGDPAPGAAVGSSGPIGQTSPLVQAERDERAAGVRRAGTVLRVMVILAGIVSGITLVAALWSRSAIAAAGGLARVETETPFALLDLFEVVGLVVLIVTGITWMIWMSRCYTVVADHRPGKMRHVSGWVYAGWIVPIANFFVPKRITDDLWTGAGRYGDGSEVPMLVHAWWGLWILSNVVSNLFATPPERGGARSLELFFVTVAFSDIIEIALVVVAVLMVGRLTERVAALR